MSESFISVNASEIPKDEPKSSEAQLVRVEKSSEVSLDSIQELALAGAELHDIDELQRGLERSLIDSGLQVMADRFGASKLLDAMQGSFNMREIVDKLAPSKQERKELLDAIQAEPIDELADKFNETVGGVATVNGAHDILALDRKYGVITIESGKDSDAARELLSPALGKLLAEKPDIADRFSQTNDMVHLLKDIRDVYSEKYDKLSLGIEHAKSAIEDKIAEIETEATELEQISDEIYSDEIAALEQKFSVASTEAARELIQGMLNKKVSEVLELRESLAARYGNIRENTINGLNASYVYSPRLAPPTQTKPTFEYSLSVAA